MHKSWPPKTCEMPELPENYGKAMLSHILNVIFARGGPTAFGAAAYTRNFVRICDLAIQEYSLAREALNEYISTPNNVISPLFKATAHLEQCIHAIRRAIRFARHKDGPRLPKVTVLTEDVESRIRGMRNAIEHTDQKIRKGIISEGEFLMLGVSSVGIELEGREILFSELAEWLTQLHELSLLVAQHREE